MPTLVSTLAGNISGWFRYTSYHTSVPKTAFLFEVGGPGADGISVLVSADGNTYLQVIDQDQAHWTGTTYDASFDVSVGKLAAGWHHILVTWDNNLTYIYVDGALAGSVAAKADLLDGYNLALGTNYSKTGHWNSEIEDFRIGNETLTPAEVDAMFDGAPGKSDFVLRFDGNLAIGADGYRVSDPIFLGEFSPIDGSRIDWDSPNDSVIVETSLDGGVTWYPAVNHQTIPGLARGAAPGNVFLTVRQRLISPDTETAPAVLNRLRVVIYSDKTAVPNTGGLDPVTTGEVDISEVPYNFVNNGQPIGAMFRRNPSFDSRIVIPSGGPEHTYRMVDFWFRRDAPLVGDRWEYILDARPGLTNGWFAFVGDGSFSKGGDWGIVYINGVQKAPTAADFPVGKWVHVALWANYDFSGPIALGNRYEGAEPVTGTIAHFAAYRNALTPTQVASHFVGGFQRHLVNLVDPRVLNVADREPKLYGFAWQTVGSGQ